ncbi:MAG: radical SAM protein [Candidatus Omnitrophota bacterium]
MSKHFKHIYGPVASWRLGSSLGVDLLGGEKKHCALDCIYCQLGARKPAALARKVFVPTSAIIAEIKALPKVHIDYITFSGSGEPTLARNLGQAIKAIKQIRPEAVAVLTGSALIYRKDVQRELSLADLVAVKLDADSEVSLRRINRPGSGITLTKILKGIIDFRGHYRGKLVLQIMCLRENAQIMPAIAHLAEQIHPDEIHLTTATRPCRVKPLPPRAMAKIKKIFGTTKVRVPYEHRRKKVAPLSEKDTLARRGRL